MNEPDDQTSAPSSPATLVIALLVGLILGAGYLWMRHSAAPSPDGNAAPVPPVVVAPLTRDAPPAADTPPAEATATAAPDATPPHPLVSPPAGLDNSDAVVRQAAADLAPALAEWLVPEQQLRKWVLAIDLMADGNVPKQYRPLAFPIARFEPASSGSDSEPQYTMTPDTHARADALVRVLTAIDPALVARYYRAWLPLLDKAYQEQGKKDHFDQRVRAALQHLVDVKPLDAEPVLVKRGAVLYGYADEHLEAASDVEKLLWRLGPDNGAKLQDFARQLQQHLPAVVR